MGPTGNQLTWAQMNVEQRKARMRTVSCRGREMFSRLPRAICQGGLPLCHGQEAEIGLFDMPTAHLPRLSGSLLLRPEFKKYPDTTRLKLNRLAPTLAMPSVLRNSASLPAPASAAIPATWDPPAPCSETDCLLRCTKAFLLSLKQSVNI